MALVLVLALIIVIDSYTRSELQLYRLEIKKSTDALNYYSWAAWLRSGIIKLKTSGGSLPFLSSDVQLKT